MPHVSCSVCGALVNAWRATALVPDAEGHERQLCPTCRDSLRRDLPAESWDRLTAVDPGHARTRHRRRDAPAAPVQLPLPGT